MHRQAFRNVLFVPSFIHHGAKVLKKRAAIKKASVPSERSPLCMVKNYLLGSRQLERFGFHCLLDAATANALHANLHRFRSATRLLNANSLQVRAELTASAPSDFGTDSAKVLGFTTSLYRIAFGWFLATYFAHA